MSLCTSLENWVGVVESASTPAASPSLFFFYILSMFVLILLFAGRVGAVKAKGTVYLSNIRMVFVSIKPVENFIAFDMPLVCISHWCLVAIFCNCHMLYKSDWPCLLFLHHFFRLLYSKYKIETDEFCSYQIGKWLWFVVNRCLFCCYHEHVVKNSGEAAFVLRILFSLLIVSTDNLLLTYVAWTSKNAPAPVLSSRIAALLEDATD